MRRTILAALLALFLLGGSLFAEKATVVDFDRTNKTLTLQFENSKAPPKSVKASEVTILNPAGREVRFESLKELRKGLTVDVRLRDGKVHEIRLLAR
jgi:hypothetical protein